MSTEQALNIIKGAILLEHKGKIFYENTAQQTKSKAVKEFFKTMALEEEKHMEILGKHYKSLLKDGKFSSTEYDEKPEDVSAAVMIKNIQQEISAAGYEAAAISAAMTMEEKAVKYYSDRANSTTNTLEKELYEWLANWEKGHLQLLSDIDKELQESIWYDNQFWPF